MTSAEWVPTGLFVGWQTTWSTPIAPAQSGPTKHWAVLAAGVWNEPASIGVKGGKIRLTYLLDESTAIRLRYVGPFGLWLSSDGRSFGPFDIAI